MLDSCQTDSVQGIIRRTVSYRTIIAAQLKIDSEAIDILSMIAVHDII